MNMIDHVEDKDASDGLLADTFGTYKYSDTPDGEDCLKKLWYVSKYCLAYGLSGSALDMLLNSHPTGAPQIAARCAYLTLPLVGMGAAFTTSTCIATRVRNKDDPLNYFIGGMSTALVAGAWLKSTRVSIYGTLAFGGIMAIKKDCDLKGVDFFYPQNVKKHITDFGWYSRDFSLTKDPKNRQP